MNDEVEELDSLKLDIALYVAIVVDQATEIEQLRAEITRLERLAYWEGMPDHPIH